jgi:hypothetical protein
MLSAMLLLRRAFMEMPRQEALVRPYWAAAFRNNPA